MVAACTDITGMPNKTKENMDVITSYLKKTSKQASYFSLNNKNKEEVYKTLLASSSLPLIYEPVNINGRYYIDGGLTDNLPIKPLYNYGYESIIAIACDNNVSLNKLKMQFPNCNLYLIKPSMYLGNFINGTLNFNRNKIYQMIKLGYKDGMKISSLYFTK